METPTSPPTQPASASREFLNGIYAQLPLLLGVAPFGMIFGALAVASGLTPFETQGFSLFVFAGSAQFVAVGLIAEGTPPFVIVLTILMINLRHLLYSASFAPYVQHLNRRWKVSLSWLLTDEAYATTITRYRRGDATMAHWFTLGTGLALWAAWQISTAVGILFGENVPGTWSLDFALPLTFLALLAPTLTNQATWAAAVAAGVFASVMVHFPYRIGFILAVILGIVVGLSVERMQAKRAKEKK